MTPKSASDEDGPAGEETGTQRAGLIGSLLIPFGIAVYGLLSFVFGRFYGPLGINPAEVGLTYTGVLVHTTGTIIVLLFFFLAPVLVLSWSFSTATPSWSWLRTILQRPLISAGMMLAVLLLYVAYIQATWTGRAATAVKYGRPVTPTVTLGFPDLPIHADPVLLLPSSKPGEAPEIDELSRRKDLLYIGQTGQTVVLYDPKGQHAVYVPTGDIVLQITNCRTKRADDPRCERVFS